MSSYVISTKFPPATPEEIQKAEQSMGIEIPEEYRQFLLKYNGGRPKPDVFPIHNNPVGDKGIMSNFFSVNESDYDSLQKIWKIFKDRIPSGYLPIAHDVGGNLLCMKLSGDDNGSIYFWDHEMELEYENPNDIPMYFVASSLNELLNRLTE